jgi:hypothetical protein
MPKHETIDPQDLPKHHHQLVKMVQKRCNTDFDEPFARAHVPGAELGVFHDGKEMDAPFVGRALANVVKPQGEGQEVEHEDEPMYFYVEDDLLNVISDRDLDDVRELLIGDVIGDENAQERVRMVRRSWFMSSQGYGRGPEDATPDAPRAGGLD